MKQTFRQIFKSRATQLGGAILLAGCLIGFVHVIDAQNISKPVPAARPEAAVASPQYDGRFTTSFAPLIKKVAPSVVKVSVTEKAQPSARLDSAMPDLRRFFGGGADGFDGPTPSTMPKQHGVGSGVVVSVDGYILTNNHVVENAEDIRVEFTDGRGFTGKVVGRDPQTDIALLKIDARDLPFLAMADSDKIEVGDVVLAVGNPFGIGQTVTSGIISAKGRATIGLDYEDFIQTDAAINPGNSGGALIDTEGRLIGINTAILSDTGGNQGIGFAVPANLAHWVMDSLVQNGSVRRGLLGVNIQDLTPQLAKEFKVDRTQGALIAGVTEDSPADRAGLKVGDVVIEFNGKPVTDSRHLKLEVAQAVPGTSIPVKVLHEGADKTVNVVVKEMANDKLAKAPAAGKESSGDALHGVAVSDLSKATRSQLAVPENVQGALITEVAPDSPAWEAGLRKGDVITEINRKPVVNAEQAVSATARPAGSQTLVRVWSRGGNRFIVVDEPKAG